MAGEERRIYKRYLQPESNNPIPISSKYRYLKLSKEHALNFNMEEKLIHSESIICNETETMENDGRTLTEIQVDELMDVDYEESSQMMTSPNTTDVNLEDQFYELSSEIASDVTRIHCVVDSLAEDIEECIIENSGSQYFEPEAEEDFFMDALDENDWYVEEDVGERKFNFKSLDDFMESPSFKNPINVKVILTVGEVLLMVLKYALVHALSLTEITDLLNMLNCIFGTIILPETRYLIDKLFFPKNCRHFHAVCPKCSAYVGEFTSKDKILKCTLCRFEIDVKDSAYSDFFVMLDISTPISKLIESHYEYYNYVVNNRIHEKGIICDIYDGKEYREFVKNLSDVDRKQYASVIFNTDGAPLFESSKYSIWPIFLMVNELPYHVRTQELILAGLWFGKKKPDFKVFLKPFIRNMKDLSTNGVQCNINNSSIFIKIFVLICCVDSVARAPVQGFNQFNGNFGCGQCLHPGQWVKNKGNSSGTMKYPLMNHVPKYRNAKDTIKQMTKTVKSRSPIKGVKNPSPLINLINFNIILGCVPESMHCVAGIAKQFATMWFGNSKKSGIFSKQLISKIDDLMLNIKVPNQLCRLSRPFSERQFWKAREWENWVLYYSLPILQTILPNDLFMHWTLFVEALFLLSKDKILTVEVDRADKLLYEFVACTQKLYSKVSMTFNVHLLLHLAKSVYEWGPIWSHNAFAFESGNGKLLKMVHAAKGIHQQICRYISLQYSKIILKENVYQSASYDVKRFFDQIGTKLVQKTKKIGSHRYFGITSVVDTTWLEKLHLPVMKTNFYKKLVKNSCLYLSFLKNNKRSNNSYALLEDGSYVKLKYFIVNFDTKQEYAIIHRIEIDNALERSCPMLKKIVKVIDEECFVPTQIIVKVCVHMIIEDKQYLCSVPNLHKY